MLWKNKQEQYEISKENIELLQKIENISQKTIREKLLTYFSNEARRNRSNIFEIPFNRQDLADAELAQADVLQALLPVLPTEDDINEYLNQYYPNGVEKKSMGIVIKEVKEALVGVDGKLVAEQVKNRLV